MLKRRLQPRIRADLEAQRAVTLLGPRQVGKTTLALAIADAVPSIYLDLEDPADRDKLADPAPPCTSGHTTISSWSSTRFKMRQISSASCAG